MAEMRSLALLVLPGLAFPAAAQTTSAAVTPGIIAAPSDPLGDIAAHRRTDEERCRRGDPNAIIVCGRPVRGGDGYRVPYRPEPGARVRLIAGEAPSAMAAMAADGCFRFCYRPVMIDLLHPASIARAIDSILNGD